MRSKAGFTADSDWQFHLSSSSQKRLAQSRAISVPVVNGSHESSSLVPRSTWISAHRRGGGQISKNPPSPPMVMAESHAGSWETVPGFPRQGVLRQVKLDPRLLVNVQGRALDKVERFAGTSDFQLVQEISICVPGGENRRVRVLIDTGASVNLIRRGLFREEDFRPAKNPVQLSTANGQHLGGGQSTIKLRMTFGQDNGRCVQPWRVWGEFYEADTKADMIISYPWLGEHRLAVIPEFGCLALRTSGFRFLPIHSCPDFDKGAGEEECKKLRLGGVPGLDVPPLQKRSGVHKGWS